MEHTAWPHPKRQGTKYLTLHRKAGVHAAPPGKLLVSSRRSSASRHLPWCTSALNSGMRLPVGMVV